MHSDNERTSQHWRADTKPWRTPRLTLQAWTRRGDGDTRRGLRALEDSDPLVLAEESRRAAIRHLDASLRTSLGEDGGRIGRLLDTLTEGLVSNTINVTDAVGALTYIIDLRRGFRVVPAERLQELSA